jgi:phenylpropionate dioxygenase-like ring-hydroxylating dioxygenase large terminal subunit
MKMSARMKGTVQRGFGSDERPVITKLWERDSIGSSELTRARGNYEPNNKQVNFRRYYDVDYFKEELEKVWKKTWLFACREEDIPKVGDRVPFDVGPLSFFIVHSKADEYKAFYNSCIHRGTILCDKSESSSVIRCPFHGWEWNNDGSLKFIPSHWDFKDVTPANGALREVKLGRWGGFIFINADPNCGPLEEALSVIPEHFKQYAPERRYTAARYRKLIAANWKASQEAFLESYHLYATHPEGVPFNGDSQSYYDIWTTPQGAVGRESVPSGVPSMHAGPEATAVSAAEVFAQVQKMWHYPDAELPVIDPKKDVRAQIGAWHRKVYEQTYGRRYDAPDTVMLDSNLYFMFPQFCIWLSEAVPFSYQFTPHPTDPEKCYFDVRLLRPCVEGKPRPPAAPVVEVGIDESIAKLATGFSFLGMIFDQDMRNLPRVQRGMRAADPARHYETLGTFQESLIQHWHELMDRFMAG